MTSEESTDIPLERIAPDTLIDGRRVLTFKASNLHKDGINR